MTFPRLCGGVNVDDILNKAVALTVIIGGISGGFSYCILNPLREAIKNLNEAVTDLRKELKNAEIRRHSLEVLVSKLEQQVASEHERINRLEVAYLEQLEHR